MLCKHCKKEIPDAAVFCCFCGKAVSQIKKETRYHANGEGCAFRLPGRKTWTARVMERVWTDPVTKKQKRKVLQRSGFATEKAARLWAMQWYTGQREKPPAPSLSHYYDLYASGEMEKLSASKRTAYRIAWNRLDDLAPRAMDTLTISDLRTVVSDHASTYYPARDMKILLGHLFELAAADGYCQKDLPSFIVLPSLEEKEAEPFSELEQAQLWKAYENGETFAAWPLLMIYTGMMPGETMKLTVDMIDLENRKITGAGLKTSTRKTSAVYLPEVIVPVLQDLIDLRGSGKLFPRQKDQLYKDYHAMMQRIGVRDLDPYSCRHTAGTALAVTENIAPETVRKIMRWSNGSRMISRYAHPDDAAALAAVDKLKRPEAK